MADREEKKAKKLAARKEAMAIMETRHEDLKLQKRAIDRVTEDVRKQTKMEKKLNEDKILEIEEELKNNKARVEALTGKCEDLRTAAKAQEATHNIILAAVDKEYNEKRVYKQKLQFKEHQTIRKKMEKEKACHPNDAFSLNLKQLEDDVRACEEEREGVKAVYNEITNKQGNVLAKLAYQKKSSDKAIEEKEALHYSLTQALKDLTAKCEDELYNKNLLIERLKFDTARLDRSIPRLVEDVNELDTIITKKQIKVQNKATAAAACKPCTK